MSFPRSGGRDDIPTLWVSSTGGHLAELLEIENAIGKNPRSHWITFDSPQSRSMLAGRSVTYVPYVAPRDWRGAIGAARAALPFVTSHRFGACMSTGAAVAGAILPLARFHGIPTYYIESAARTTGPSLTGRLMSVVPGIHTFTQHVAWATRRWQHEWSVLSSWQATLDDDRNVDRGPLTILVTLGTISPYRFDRLVDAVKNVLIPGDRVTWQLGVTSRDDLPGAVHDYLEHAELLRSIEAADVVVSHAGVGSILSILRAGKCPVLVARSPRWSEHVDDHQTQLIREVTRAGIARELSTKGPSRDVLASAASVRITPNSMRQTGGE